MNPDSLIIRKVVKTDIDQLKEVVHSSGLFPSDFLEEIIADYLYNPETKDIWFTCTMNNAPVAIGYCAPEKLTDGTYNLLAIAVIKELQSQGIGKKMMTYIEDILVKSQNRILIVETSSDDQCFKTRNFYEKIGYSKEAVIRDFWKEGEDKIVYWKKLNFRKDQT